MLFKAKSFKIFLGILAQLWNKTIIIIWKIYVMFFAATNFYCGCVIWKNDFINKFITLSLNEPLHKFTCLRKENVSLVLFYQRISSLTSCFFSACSIILCRILSDKYKKPLKSLFSASSRISINDFFWSSGFTTASFILIIIE